MDSNLYGLFSFKNLSQEMGITIEQYNAVLNKRAESASSNKKIVDAFNEFSKENESKCRPKSYFINQEKITEWIDAQQTSEAKTLASLMTRVLKHVSFDEWYGVIIKICVELIQHIREKKFEQVVMVISENMRKSNTYVALLMFKMLYPYITALTTQAKNHGVFYKPEYGMPRTLFIHVDDCTYTGTQIVSDVQELKEFFTDAALQNVEYIIACPYIGSTARTFFNTNLPSCVKCLRSSVGFNTLYEDLNKILDNEPGYTAVRSVFSGAFLPSPEIKLRWGLAPRKSFIYFDHKLADRVSIYMSVLCLGTVMSTDGNTSIGSLISGCENHTFYKKGLPFTDASQGVPMEFDQDRTCPITIYKHLDYTFRGVSLTQKSGNIISILTSIIF